VIGCFPFACHGDATLRCPDQLFQRDLQARLGFQSATGRTRCGEADLADILSACRTGLPVEGRVSARLDLQKHVPPITPP
jgi:hypothetical protein